MILYGNNVRTVLVIDEDPGVHCIFEKMLSDECRVDYARSLQDGKRYLRQQAADLVFIDSELTSAGALETVREVRRINDHVRVVIMSGTEDSHRYLDAVKRRSAGMTPY